MTVAITEETALVTLTESAAEKLRTLMAEKNLTEHGLRVFVAGGGCGGLQYGMTFDSNPRDVDLVFEQYGLRVIVDPRSVEYIAGANIDYVDSLMGGGFQIENPNAVSTCGCGQSFKSKDQAGAEGGAGCGSCH
jgi:iron-sulfur cluster assembly accessory protein